MGTIGLTAACGSDQAVPAMGGTGGTGGTSGAVDAGLPPIVSTACVMGANSICLPSGFPFVQAAFAHSDACGGVCPAASPAGTTILFTQPVSGTLCLSGANSTQNGTGLTLSFTKFADLGSGRLMVLKRFNADLLHITQVRFTIDRPPSEGLTVGATTIHNDVCNGVDCLTFGFTLPNRITASGTPTTAALVDFVNSPPQTFDTRALDSIGFDVGPGAFDFCVRDFQFLDVNGAVVKP